jgi:hypothetical protein
MGFEWSGLVATAISWSLTFSAVCVGYIFFRARNIPQAFAMLKALVSPSTYGHLTLDHSLYFMTFLASAGYFAIIGAAELLDRVGESARRWARSTPFAVQRRLATFTASLADQRWVWIAPAVLVLGLYLSVIFQPGQAETGPVMYALF